MKRKPGVDPELYGRQSFKMAMALAALLWPGTSISDGAFDILRQVAEYQSENGHD